MAGETREARQIREAKNQSLYREVNEQIERLRGTATSIDFVCECTLDDCAESITMTSEEYEAVRNGANLFLVNPGHIDDVAERVVVDGERFQLVEKMGAGADVAARLHPRMRPGRQTP
jgi:hypothetical protein